VPHLSPMCQVYCTAAQIGQGLHAPILRTHLQQTHWYLMCFVHERNPNSNSSWILSMLACVQSLAVPLAVSTHRFLGRAGAFSAAVLDCSADFGPLGRSRRWAGHMDGKNLKVVLCILRIAASRFTTEIPPFSASLLIFLLRALPCLVPFVLCYP
jgi:hypothetical protein